MDAPHESHLPTVTLEPYAMLDGDSGGIKPGSTDMDVFMQALTGPAVLVDLLLDPEAIDSAVPEGWAAANEMVSRALGAAPKPERRLRAHMFAWADNDHAIQAAMQALNRPMDAVAHLTARDIPELLKPMPMVGLFTELMVRRHLEVGRRWRGNDLVDMMYLAAGAAYCDYVAAERSTGLQLRQVLSSLGRRQNVFVTLEELVAQLEADGVKTSAERSEK